MLLTFSVSFVPEGWRKACSAAPFRNRFSGLLPNSGLEKEHIGRGAVRIGDLAAHAFHPEVSPGVL